MTHKISVITIFPEIFSGFTDSSLIGKALTRGLISIDLINIRDFADPPHLQVDDTPYGGGAGMVMKPEPLSRAVQSATTSLPNARRILLSPRGRVFTQADALRLSKLTEVIYVCGRYEGVDERFIENYIDEEISIGDYILMGGEVAAMALIEASTRLISGVLGNSESILNESFSSTEDLLEAPHYTRPAEFEGKKVPEVLMSGNHKNIEDWRANMALTITKKRRGDLNKK